MADAFDVRTGLPELEIQQAFGPLMVKYSVRTFL
jgi:hypothetical protein